MREKKSAIAYFLFTAFIVFVMTCILPAQEKNAISEFYPTAEQAKDLKIADDAITIAAQRMQLIQAQMQGATTDYNAAIAAAKATAEKIRKENGWPDSVSFDVQTMKFKPPPAPQSVTCTGTGENSCKPVPAVKP